jgi:hypothetical protein
MQLPHQGAADPRALVLEVDVDTVKLGLSAVAVVVQIAENFPSSSATRNSASSSFPQRVIVGPSNAVESAAPGALHEVAVGNAAFVIALYGANEPLIPG